MMGKDLYIKKFHSTQKLKISEAGTKAVNIQTLRKLDAIVVPNGFVITSKALTDFLKEAQLYEWVCSIRLNKMTNKEIIAFSNDIVPQILQHKLPNQIIEEIHHNLETIAPKQQPLAIRSSSSSEDKKGNSSAGVYSSQLGIIGIKQAVKAIKKTWASSFSQQALLYQQRNRKTINRQFAVVIQQLIPAISSGTVFTVDPVNNNHQSIIIEASWGLGETVVQGLTTPDNYRVDKRTFQVTSKRIAQKDYQLQYKLQKLRKTQIAKPKRRQPVLSDQQLKKTRTVISKNRWCL